MTQQVDIYDPIDGIDQFEEMVELMEETRHILQEFIKKNKKNKELFDEIKCILEDFKDLNLKT